MPDDKPADRIVGVILTALVSAIAGVVTPFFSWIRGGAFGQSLFDHLNQSLSVQVFPPGVRISGAQCDQWAGEVRDAVLGQLTYVPWYALPFPVIFVAVLLHVLFKRFRDQYATKGTRVVRLYVRHYDSITIAIFAVLLLLAVSVRSPVAFAWVMFTILLPGFAYIAFNSKDLRARTFIDVATYVLVALAFLVAMVDLPALYAKRLFDPAFFVIEGSGDVDPLSAKFIIDGGTGSDQVGIGTLSRGTNGSVTLSIQPGAATTPKGKSSFRTVIENLARQPKPIPIDEELRNSLQQKLSTARVIQQ